MPDSFLFFRSFSILLIGGYMKSQISVKAICTTLLILLVVYVLAFDSINRALITHGLHYMSELNLYVLLSTIFFFIIVYLNGTSYVNASSLSILPFLLVLNMFICFFRPFVWSPGASSNSYGFVFASFYIIIMLFACIAAPSYLLNKYQIKYNSISYFLIIVIFASFHFIYPLAKEHEFRWGDQFYPKYVHDLSLEAATGNNVKICNKLLNTTYNKNYFNKFHNVKLKFNLIESYEPNYFYDFPFVALGICYSSFNAIKQNNEDKCFMNSKEMKIVRGAYSPRCMMPDKCQWKLIAYNCVNNYNEYYHIQNKIYQNNEVTSKCGNNMNNIDNNTSLKDMKNNFDMATENNPNFIGKGYLGGSYEQKFVAGEILEYRHVDSNGLYDITMKGNKRTAKIRFHTMFDIHGMREICFNISDINMSGVLIDERLTKIKLLKYDRRQCNFDKFDYTKY